MKLWYCCDCFQDKCMNKYIYPGLSFSFLLKSELNSWLESTLNEWRGMLGGSVAAHHITRWCKPALPLMDRFTVRSGLQQVNAIMVIPMNINIIITVQTISSPVHHVHRWWPPDHLKYYIFFFKNLKLKFQGCRDAQCDQVSGSITSRRRQNKPVRCPDTRNHGPSVTHLTE